MSTRSEGLASKVEKSNNDLLATAESSTDEQWRAICADGDWTQGFAAYHAAASITYISGMVEAMAGGQSLPPITMAQIDENNAAQAKENAARTKQEAVGLIRSNSPAAVQMVRGLTDEQLDRKAALLVGMPEVSVEQVIEMLLVGHPAGHAQSIRGAR